MLEGKLINIPALGHQNKGKSGFSGSDLFVLMSQCGNNNDLALQHGGFCTTCSLVAKDLLAASDEQRWRKHQAGNIKDHAKSKEPLGKRKNNMTSQAAYCLSQLAGQYHWSQMEHVTSAELTKLVKTKLVNMFTERGQLSQKNLSV